MLNNFLFNYFIFISVFISINLVIRLYNIYKFRYLFSFELSTFLDLNGINLITYITFKNIKSSPFIKWKSKDNYINLFKTLIYVIKNDSLYFNKKLCIIISEVNQNNLFNVLADPIINNWNDINSPIELFKLFKWFDYAFTDKDNNNNIVFIIKIL